TCSMFVIVQVSMPPKRKSTSPAKDPTPIKRLKTSEIEDWKDKFTNAKANLETLLLSSLDTQKILRHTTLSYQINHDNTMNALNKLCDGTQRQIDFSVHNVNGRSLLHFWAVGIDGEGKCPTTEMWNCFQTLGLDNQLST